MSDDYPRDLGIVPRDPDEVSAEPRTAGARIRTVREERGLTQEALAAAEGWSVETLSAIEAGESSLAGQLDGVEHLVRVRVRVGALGRWGSVAVQVGVSRRLAPVLCQRDDSFLEDLSRQRLLW